MNVNRAAAPIREYRSDIDGLRAIAVLGVIGFHTFPSFIQGGFIGVDIFFVISGFLITSLINRQLENGNFSVYDFYARRIRRIFPALILVFLTISVYGWFQLLPIELAQLGKHLFSGATFISNAILWGEVGYFDDSSEAKPLLHLWSLAIEEQFYIFWPLLLCVAFKFNWATKKIIATLCIGSFILNLLLISINMADASFYWPISRFWELAIGGFVALYARTSPSPDLRIKNCIAFFAMILIACGFILINKTRLFPGGWALLPVMGAALLIWSGKDTHINRLVFAHPILIWFGKISYPLYLWHWIGLYILSRHGYLFEGNVQSRLARVSLIGLCIGLSYITFRYVERPLRHTIYTRQATTGLCAILLACGLWGGNTYLQHGYADRYPNYLQELIHVKTDMTNEWRIGRCFLNPNQDYRQFHKECDSILEKPNVLLWGDSHAAALYPGLQTWAQSNSWNVAQFTASTCAPLLNWAVMSRPHCIEVNAAVIRKIAEIRPQIVILHANWILDYDIPRLQQTITQLQELGIQKIILVGAVPHWRGKLSNVVVEYWRSNKKALDIPYRLSYGLENAPQTIELQLQTIAQVNHIFYFSPRQFLCRQQECLAITTRLDTKTLSTFDDAHLSPDASIFLIEGMAKHFLH